MDNINEHFESIEDEKVHQILGGLKRVGAPKDFDFRVKARIAAGKPSANPGYRIPTAIRAVVPLVLLVIVGAYFGINSLYFPTKEDVPAVAETKPGPGVLLAEPPSQNGGVVPGANPEDERALGKIPETINSIPKVAPGANLKSINRKSDSSGKKPVGGSFEDTSVSRPTILPRYVNPNGNTPAKPEDFNRKAQVPASEGLSSIGVNAKLAGSGWKVDTIKKDSPAERSGLKTGDVIESGFGSKTLRILRDGKHIQIELKP